MEILIRQARPEDGERIAAISTLSLGYPCEAALVCRRLEALDLSRERVFVAERGGEVIGFVHGELYRLLYQEDLVNILGLAVDSACQGKGAGRLLMAAVEDWAKHMGCTGVRLNSGSARLEAHGFYTHLGYSNTKQQKRFLKSLK